MCINSCIPRCDILLRSGTFIIARRTAAQLQWVRRGGCFSCVISKTQWQLWLLDCDRSAKCSTRWRRSILSACVNWGGDKEGKLCRCRSALGIIAKSRRERQRWSERSYGKGSHPGLHKWYICIIGSGYELGNVEVGFEVMNGCADNYKVRRLYAVQRKMWKSVDVADPTVQVE